MREQLFYEPEVGFAPTVVIQYRYRLLRERGGHEDPDLP